MLDGAGHGVVGGDEDEGHAGLETRSSGLGPWLRQLGIAVRHVDLDVCGFGLDVAVLLDLLWFWSRRQGQQGVIAFAVPRRAVVGLLGMHRRRGA